MLWKWIRSSSLPAGIIMMINKKSMLHLVGMLFYVCGTVRLEDVRLGDVRLGDLETSDVRRQMSDV